MAGKICESAISSQKQSTVACIHVLKTAAGTGFDTRGISKEKAEGKRRGLSVNCLRQGILQCPEPRIKNKKKEDPAKALQQADA